jgi:hypothetical protein
VSTPEDVARWPAAFEPLEFAGGAGLTFFVPMLWACGRRAPGVLTPVPPSASPDTGQLAFQ